MVRRAEKKGWLNVIDGKEIKNFEEFEHMVNKRIENEENGENMRLLLEKNDDNVETIIKRLPDGSWVCLPKDKKLGKPKLKLLKPGDFIKEFNDAKISVNSFSDDMFIMDNQVYFRDDINVGIDPEPDGKTVIKVPFGIYNAENYKRWVRLSPKVINKDDYVNLHDDKANEIYTDIDKFCINGDRYKAAGLIKKRGILLYGPPGCGKTMIINHVLDKYKDQARILFVVDDEIIGSNMIENWKVHFAKDLTIFVIEELTQYCNLETDLSNLFLAFLDGQSSWDNCLVIATTNYPERLPGNIIDRPSRFDRIIRVDTPTPTMRRKYLEKMLDKGSITDAMIKKTEGYSIAHIKEICIQMMIHGKSFEEVFVSAEITMMVCLDRPGLEIG